MANAECVYVVPRSLVNALDASSDSRCPATVCFYHFSLLPSPQGKCLRLFSVITK